MSSMGVTSVSMMDQWAASHTMTPLAEWEELVATEVIPLKPPFAAVSKPSLSPLLVATGAMPPVVLWTTTSLTLMGSSLPLKLPLNLDSTGELKSSFLGREHRRGSKPGSKRQRSRSSIKTKR